ncbi:MAG TPA: hypothetical protein VN685_00475 [Rhizomicrobium sp.]|nr:hypothetical protein [Rhizomicrobium sp.]
MPRDNPVWRNAMPVLRYAPSHLQHEGRRLWTEGKKPKKSMDSGPRQSRMAPRSRNGSKGIFWSQRGLPQFRSRILCHRMRRKIPSDPALVGPGNSALDLRDFRLSRVKSGIQ